MPAQARSGNVAALQVALGAVGLYGGQIDGIKGPRTRRAVRRFQRRKGLAVDGIAGPRTRRALGRRGRPPLGSRAMRPGHRGWDVAALQFGLARRGFSPGSIDGGFGPATARALRRYQRAAGLTADAVAGPATLTRMRSRVKRRRTVPRPVGGPVLFFRPVGGPITDGFGMRWGRMHQGIDFPAASGTRVEAAGRGVVSFAGWNTGGYGNLVIVDHRLGYQTWYAHLAAVTSYRGEVVSGGTRIGLVGSTGYSTGPHLHFEVRRNGTPIDPLPRLLGGVASSSANGARARPHAGCERSGLERRRRSGGRRASVSVC